MSKEKMIRARSGSAPGLSNPGRIVELAGRRRRRYYENETAGSMNAMGVKFRDSMFGGIFTGTRDRLDPLGSRQGV